MTALLKKWVATPSLPALLSFALILSDSSHCQEVESSPAPLSGLIDPPTMQSSMSWEKISEGGKPFSTGWHETWRLSDSRSKSETTIRFDFRRQSPPPSVSEVARAFRTAASRASYASDVSDREMEDGSQWVEYRLPMQGESGFKKIMSVPQGIVTATLALPLSASASPESIPGQVEAVRVIAGLSVGSVERASASPVDAGDKK